MDAIYRDEAIHFSEELPYRQPPYSKRNWGHSWHSLCSYNGKLKPAIAHMLVEIFTKPGEVVLDPLCGVGTIPFEACLQGRIGIGNDLSEMAYVVSKAKLEAPVRKDVEDVIKNLEKHIDRGRADFHGDSYSDFGLNGKLPDYFEEHTYEEILLARQYFLQRFDCITSAEAFAYASLLHILHGNRPYALSRRSHPLTPYAPTGGFEYKSLIVKLSDKVNLAFQNNTMEHYKTGRAIYGDYLNLIDAGITADVIISSPPFADSIRFYTYNWMRLWMCGWEPEDFNLAETKFLDNRQKKNFDVYYSFFDVCNAVLKPRGKLILHLGRTKKIDMAKELSLRAEPWFDIVYSSDEQVGDIEKHGIKDKGATLAHQYLFLQKKI